MFDREKADHAVDFINCLKHTKGRWRGVPFELLPWQDRIIRDVFGTVKENGYRQYNTAYVEIPKKNGKSELAAGVALYMTCGDGEWGAEVYGCASDRQQASIVFDVAVDMVDQCPALKKRMKPVMSVKRLVYKPTNSFYQVLSAEAYTKHGLNVHAVIFDELHAQPNRELFDVMTKGSGDARTQPLFFLITTAGTDRNSVCFEQHQKAEDIILGRKIDPAFYPVIYGASDDADWSSEKVWYQANPSLGHTIDIEKVWNAYLSAKDNPAEENIFRQLRLNQWVKQSTRWMQMEKWDNCAFPVDERELIGRECYGGLDLSSSIDITAFVLVFPPRDDAEKYIILPYFWIPEENMNLRVRRDHVPYDVWEKQGCLMTTEGNVIHYGFIENFIDELGKKFHIREIAFDRWGAVQMVQNLEGLGFTVVPFGQGFKDMSPPSKRLMELVLEKRIAHGGHPVLRWMMDNIFVRTDPAGNIKPDKEKSTEKIDGAVATVMALDRAIRNEGNAGGSVYDDRGILIF
ncbi:terminase large subunit [Blautia hominis]|uniref:Terminase large subunit n=1 Tax=Blautia hominis TaxID=2025493 RepID=A0ABQ0B5F0_9FIRM